MTTTITRTPLTATAPTTGTTADAGTLLAVLDDALWAVAEEEPEVFDARTPAGTAATSLSAIARRAAAALGAEPGVHLTEGPGVVVVRDLVTATRLLARAVEDAGIRSGTEFGELVTAARGVRATLRDVLTSCR